MVITRYIIKTEGNGIISAGTVTPWAGGSLPEGWLECDGSHYDPEQYPELHEMLQTVRNIYAPRSVWDKVLRRKPVKIGEEAYGTYGHNRLPDLRGRATVR